MSDEPIPYALTEAGALALRITDLEHSLRHFDRTSMDLYHYVRAVDGLPTEGEWTLICDQIKEMVDAYGPRNPNR
jgi:hypothetical protein